MKLNFNEDCNRTQPDPYVIKHDGKYYMYATGAEGVQLYIGENMYDWEYKGLCFGKEGCHEYWAPAVLYYKGTFYMYVSFVEKRQRTRTDNVFA